MSTIAEILKANGVFRSPQEIYAIHSVLGHEARSPEDSAKAYGISVDQFWELLEQGKKDHEAFLIVQNYHIGAFNAKKIREANFPEQMEALTIARGGLTFAELSKLTGIQASRIQRICKGEKAAFLYEFALIGAKTNYKVEKHFHLIAQEALNAHDKMNKGQAQ